VAVAVSSGDQPVAGGLPIAEYPDSGGGDLAGTRWKVYAYQADGELAYTRPGETAIILQFGYDGTISGTGGCNTYEAGYAVSGEYLSSAGGLGSHGAYGQLIAFNDFTATETVCASEVMAAEAAYFTALQEAGRWSIENDRELNLSTEDNTDLIGARPQPNN
jgi:heat shock protein HslJ